MIQVKDGLVEVRAPFKIEQKEIDSFVLHKMSWINKKLSLQKSLKKLILLSLICVQVTGRSIIL